MVSGGRYVARAAAWGVTTLCLLASLRRKTLVPRGVRIKFLKISTHYIDIIMMQISTPRGTLVPRGVLISAPKIRERKKNNDTMIMII